MNYFTPTQQRIAMVETASYNQKLLALRARRLAQQRMNFCRKIATMRPDEDEVDMGEPPQITEHSDDEEHELEEIFAPVPYQKGYWLAAQRQKQKQKQEKLAQKQKQQAQARQAQGATSKQMYQHPPTTTKQTQGQ